MLITPALIALVIGVGAVAGGFGTMLGIGGGVFLVPFLNVVLGLPLPVASGISLMTVIATSSAVATGGGTQRLINMRLAMVLQVAASGGALLGALTVVRLPGNALRLTFAAVTAAVALLMLRGLDQRNIVRDCSVDKGAFGGRFVDADCGEEVVYRTRRVPLAFAVSGVAGFISGLLGLGGGILIVPALNAWCSVPMRAAAATSSVMIGVTALASAPIFYARGHISVPLAAAAVIGVLFGSRVGLWLSSRAPVKWLKLLMAIILGFVSLTYAMRAL